MGFKFRVAQLRRAELHGGVHRSDAEDAQTPRSMKLGLDAQARAIYKVQPRYHRTSLGLLLAARLCHDEILSQTQTTVNTTT